jgi:hypothetical protein
MLRFAAIKLCCLSILLTTHVVGCDDAPQRENPPDAALDDSGDADAISPSGDGAAVDAPAPDTTAPSGRTPAGGLHLTGIRANQGVDVILVKDRKVVAKASRAAPLISKRGVLIRVNYTMDVGFKKRAVDGLLELTQANGSTKVLTHTRTVSAAANIGAYNGTFRWFVDATKVQAGTKISVLLAEPDGVKQTSGDASEARLPASGQLALSAWGDRMVLDIVLVPYDCGGSYKPLDLSKTNIDDFKHYLFNTYPVQEINLTVHKTLTPSKCDEYEVAEKDLPALRTAEKAPAHVYYGGLLNGNGGGYSIYSGESHKKTFRRTFALHSWRDFGLTFDLFAHELGHNHARKHSFSDTNYPFKNDGKCGGRGNHGYGVVSSMFPHSGYGNDKAIGLPWINPHTRLLAPSDPKDCSGHTGGNKGNWNDFMSYTYPYWVSAYTYAGLAQRVKLISTWSTSSPLMPSPEGKTLRAIIKPDGQVDWNHNVGASAVGQPAGYALCYKGKRQVARYDLRGGHSHRERFNSAGVLELQRYTVLELPVTGESGDRCVLHHEGAVYNVEIAALRGF